MDAPPAPAATPRSAVDSLAGGLPRQTVDLLVCLCIGVLVFRTFSAEAYVVPTGSMAPTLLGLHREVTCSSCGISFVVGIDEQGETGRSLCPNCGQTQVEGEASVVCGGDRVLVHKFLYDLRSPRRWEVAVFHFPDEPTQAYVKRVVGLPGESIRIAEGDIYADGAIARKTLDEIRALRVLVHDSRFVAEDAPRYPRWDFSRGMGSRELPSGWSREGRQFVHQTPAGDPVPVDDWLSYRHWEPTRSRYGPILDFYPYNGADFRSDHPVADLSVEARIVPGPDVESVSLAFSSAHDHFLIRIPVVASEEVKLFRNGRRIEVETLPRAPSLVRDPSRPTLLEASVVDRRVQVAVDGRPLFQPLDYDARPERPGGNSDFLPIRGGDAEGPPPPATIPASACPFSLGVRGGSLVVTDLKLYRDIYYTPSLAQTPRHAFGVLEPYHLGEDEYFVLGDNSPVSNDSRFWPKSPVVHRSMFLGKPFLVHLPGQVVPLEVFGRSVYWVPDPRQIRYIR